MGDLARVLSLVASARAEAVVIQGGGPPPPPPPPPPVGDLSWFLSRPALSISNIPGGILQALNPWAAGTKVGTGGFRAILAASGMVFCPWMGKAGWLIVFGGGHDDYYGNDVYAYDLFSGVWMQLKAANWPLYRDANGYHASQTEGEHWSDASCTATLQNQPSSGHNYGIPLALAPSTEFPKGAVLMGGIPSLTPLGQRHGSRAHVFDLATNQWARYSTNSLPGGIDYGHAFLDRTRNRAMIPVDGGLAPLDLATRTYGPKIGGMATGAPYKIWTHWEAEDLYVALWRYIAPSAAWSEVWVCDPKVGSTKRLPMPWPNTTAPGGGAWSARHGGFVYYHGQGEREVILVKPSASPRTTPWIVSSIALTGDLPAADTMVGAGAHCKRFLEHPQADGFVWLGQTSAPPQWFRV